MTTARPGPALVSARATLIAFPFVDVAQGEPTMSKVESHARPFGRLHDESHLPGYCDRVATRA